MVKNIENVTGKLKKILSERSTDKTYMKFSVINQRLCKKTESNVRRRFSAHLTLFERSIANGRSVCPSLSYTREPRLRGSRYPHTFYTYDRTMFLVSGGQIS